MRVKEVLHREVGKLQAQLTNHTRLSPTGRELDLVVGLRHQVILDVDGAILWIRQRHRIHVLWVEVSHLCQLTHRTHQVFTAKEHTGLRAQLSANDVFIQAIVTLDDHLVDRSLRTLLNTDLQRDRVALHVGLDRIGVEEEVAIVEVDVRHGIVVGAQTLVQLLLVIHLAGLHAQHGHQVVRCVLRVTHETNIFQVVLLSLLNLEMDIYLLLVIVPNAIREQHRIAITMLVVLCDHIVLIILILFGRELLGAEHLQDTGLPVVVEAELLVRLLHRLLQVASGECGVAFERDSMDLRLLVFINIDVYNDLSLVCGIVFLLDLYVNILKALSIEELLDHQFGTIHNVWSHLETFLQTQFRIQIFTLALLDAMIVHLRDTRTLLQLHLQPDLVALDFGCQDLYIREQSMLPKAPNGLRDLIARDSHLVAYRKPRKTNQHKVIIVFDSCHLDVGDLVFLWRHIRNHRHLHRSFHLHGVSFLCKGTACNSQTYKTQLNFFTFINHRFVYQINCSLVFPNRRSRRW